MGRAAAGTGTCPARLLTSSANSGSLIESSSSVRLGALGVESAELAELDESDDEDEAVEFDLGRVTSLGRVRSLGRVDALERSTVPLAW